MDPTPTGLTDHVTVWLAVNCSVCPSYNVAVVGLIETGGRRVTVAVATFVVSAWPVAVTVIVCWLATTAGAVYNPLSLIAPTPAGLTDHVTAWFAVNDCACPLDRIAVAGVTLSGGSRLTVATANLVVSAWMVAITVTVSWLAMVGGAVYSPVASIVPTPEGSTVHVTVWFDVNCCVWPPYNIAVDGVTVNNGNTVSVAVTDLDVSAWLVAVIVTVCGVAALAGAVYIPVASMVPAPEGLTAHVTA
jgi:hypothetical protein